MGGGFFLGFPGYGDQSALSFLKGRLSRCLSSFSLIVEPCRGRKFSCSGFFCSIIIGILLLVIRALDSLIFGYFLRILSFSGGVLLTLVLR